MYFNDLQPSVFSAILKNIFRKFIIEQPTETTSISHINSVYNIRITNMERITAFCHFTSCFLLIDIGKKCFVITGKFKVASYHG